MTDRFRFEGFVERKVPNPRLNIVEALTFAIFEDTKTGMVHEVPSRLGRAQRAEYVNSEMLVVLEDASGEGSPVGFTVLVGEAFHLTSEPEGPGYRVARCLPGKVVLEWMERGRAQTVVIPIEDGG